MTGKVDEIHINQDEKCPKCGKPGSVNGGLCLECATRRLTTKIIDAHTINPEGIEMPKLKTLQHRLSVLDTSKGSAATERKDKGYQRTHIVRPRILFRDEYICQICKRVFSPMNLEIDHVVPLAAGGSDFDHNKQTICKWCHKAKTAREERERQFV